MLELEGPLESLLELPVNETLVSTCQMFLVPLTILFAAVGVANTRFVKLLVCLGVAIAGCGSIAVALDRAVAARPPHRRQPRRTVRVLLVADRPNQLKSMISQR